MKTIKELLDNNSNWAHGISEKDPNFFHKLAQQQKPKYLWIGCSDSRVPANQIVGLIPGEIFVHRNVANLVIHTDLNCLSAIQFAVEVLQVEHIIVCGHYGCGGVEAAYQDRKLGLISNWLMHIQDVKNKYRSILEQYEEESLKVSKLCELNVIEQAANVSQTTIVQAAWERSQTLNVHAWIYSINDGLIKDLKMSISSKDEVMRSLQSAVRSI